MKKFLALALSFALTLPLAACGGNPGNASAPPSGSSNTQDSIQISYAHMGAESSMVGAWGILFKEKVEAASDGKITVNIFSNGEMGSDVEAIESVLDNTIQIAAMQPSPCVAFVPELGVFDLPCAFSTSTAEEINEVLNQSDFKTKLDGYFANAGLKCLGFTQGASFRQFSSNKKLTSIEDFKGLNMRVMDNQYQIKFWSDMGCNTTPVPGSELYMSLQNESYFNSLPAAYQEIIENAVAETTVEMIPVYQEADQTAYDTLIESGMEINELSAEDMAAMREIAQPVYDMVRSEIGDEAVDALVSVIQ